MCSGEIQKYCLLSEAEVLQLQLFADASGARLNGFGCVYKDEWAWGTWAHTTIFNQITPNIALLELFAIVVAVEIWAPQLAGKTIVLRSDNTATVACINTMKSEIPACQRLLKHMSLNCLHYQLFFKAVHVRGVENTLSNLLSKGKLRAFREVHLSAAAHPRQLPVALWPPTWSRSEMLLVPCK